jgi:hypothetical protein
MDEHEKIKPDQWFALVADVLASQPELLRTTVEAVQAGITAALDHQRERTVTLSIGLHEALRTERRAKTRKHDVIVEAIEVSNLHPSKWSKEAIERETRATDGK